MIKLDDDLLRELGLAGLPPEEKKKLLAHIYETLEMRVGMKLAEQMSDAQLSEFERFIEAKDEAGALRWLETNFPNYKDVVASEFEILKKEIGQVAPQILAASGGQGQPQPGDPAAAGPVPMGQPLQQPMPPAPGMNPGGLPPQAPQPMGPAPMGPQHPQPGMGPQAPQPGGQVVQGPWGPQPPQQPPAGPVDPNPWQQPPQQPPMAA